MSHPPAHAIEARDLVKRFGELRAVDRLNLAIRRGELLSLLGPNGAGKSTTIRILSTLMPADEGEVLVGDYRLPGDIERIKPLLGLVPQDIALYDMLSARYNLSFFGRLYGLSGPELDGRVNGLLESVGLTERAGDPVFTLSGGMQRRVNIAAALVHDPEIVFMDEPTVGLDPVSRAEVWTVIEHLKARGKTIVLTTHYMEEAEALSDRVAIVDRGKVIAIGSPDDLIRDAGVQTLLRFVVEGDAAGCVAAVQELPRVSRAAARDGELRVQAESGSELLPQVIQTLVNCGLEVRAAEVTAPNLGAVYLHYTGRELRGAEQEKGEEPGAKRGAG